MICLWYSSGNRLRQLLQTAPSGININQPFVPLLVVRGKDSPGTLFVGFNAVLHPKQVLVFTANFINPPTVGVAICIVLVWSPDTTADISALHTGDTGSLLTQRGSLLSQDGFEDTHERLGELVIQIILRIDRDIILENI